MTFYRKYWEVFCYHVAEGNSYYSRTLKQYHLMAHFSPQITMQQKICNQYTRGYIYQSFSLSKITGNKNQYGNTEKAPKRQQCSKSFSVIGWCEQSRFKLQRRLHELFFQEMRKNSSVAACETGNITEVFTCIAGDCVGSNCQFKGGRTVSLRHA